MEESPLRDVRTRPAQPNSARLFNLSVAALVFCLMFAFAAWVTIGAFDGSRTKLPRAFAGTLIGIAALMLLAAVRAGWRSGEPFQHGHGFILGMALFGIGVTVLVAG
jgi:presenilin-like A22 family membrane protease